MGPPRQIEKEVKKLVMSRSWHELYWILIDKGENLNPAQKALLEETKVRIALTMASKDVPTEVKHTGGVVIDYGHRKSIADCTIRKE